VILIVSDPDDLHVPPVAAALDQLGLASTLLDLASLPRLATLTIGHGTGALEARLRTKDGRILRAEEVEAVWWRRPRQYEPHAELAPEHARFAFDQLHEAMAGLWSALPVRWVNQPWHDQRADHKVGQLLLAEPLGLAIPQTMVTTSPEDARAFLAARRGMRFVRKMLRPSAEHCHPTRLMGEADLAQLDALRYGPAIIQEYVEGVDVRVTIAGEALFAAEIDPRDTSSPHDFRPVLAQCRVAAATLPAPVEAALRRLMDRLGLVYGAIDLRRTDDGRYLFLECNPAGQWLFVETRTGQPISAAVAGALAGPTRGRSALRRLG
jgi:glutathione synthase/RimK-type ligase-like ATP-grasp enzyme